MNGSAEYDLRSLLDAPFEFTRQPDPIPPALRPERRVPLALLLVSKSHGSSGSWKGLQLLNWAIREPRNTELILALRGNNDMPDLPVVRFEPALDRALDLAVGLELLEQQASGAYKLTAPGKRLVSQIIASGAFAQERALLDSLPGKLTKKDVSHLLEWRVA